MSTGPTFRGRTARHGDQLGFLGAIQFAILSTCRPLAGQRRCQALDDTDLAHPMDSRLTGVQCLSNLGVGPVALAFTDIRFQ